MVAVHTTNNIYTRARRNVIIFVITAMVMTVAMATTVAEACKDKGIDKQESKDNGTKP